MRRVCTSIVRSLALFLVLPMGLAGEPEETDPDPAAQGDDYYQTRSAWDEAEKGPLPRWRLGPDGENATPKPDPGLPLTPRAVHAVSIDSAPDSCAITSPPEYAPVDGILFRFAHNAWAGVVTDLVTSLTADPGHDEIAYVVVASDLQQTAAEFYFTNAGADLSKVRFIVAPNDTIWIRDYGPHFIWQGGADATVDSHYYPGRALDNFIPTLLADDYWPNPSYDIPLYYSGGNFQPSADRQGFVTSLIHSDNPGFGEARIADLYQEYQGVDTLHIFTQLPGSVDGTGHIDMWFYLVDEDTVIISEFLPGENQTAIDITNNAVPYMEGLGYEVFRVPAFNAVHPGYGNAHYTYTNAFRANDRIFIPSYGEGNAAYAQYDSQALAAWQAAAGPGVEIVPINSYDIIWAAGAIHCIIMQVPRYTDSVPSACATSPAGGELLVPGTPHEITWTASDDGTVSAVDLYYSVDGGFTYPPGQAIATGLTDEGSHTWTVPQIESTQGRVKVVAHDDEVSSTEAESEMDFAFESALRHLYDFSAGAGTDKFAWGDRTDSWANVDGIRLPVATELTTEQYGQLAASDATGDLDDANRYVSVMGPSDSSREATHVFEFTLDEDPGLIRDIGVRWEGFADDCAQMELYVWDYTAGQWCDGRGGCGVNAFMDNFAGNRDESLGAHIRADFDRYIDLSGRLTLLAYTERGGDPSAHDYLSVTVTWDACLGTDGDFDGYADGCDNCLAIANPDQANGDGDALGDLCDCAPADGTAFASPIEIEGVTLPGDGSMLEWDSDAGNSGSGTSYDVMRGDTAGFPVGSGAGETCSGTGSTDTFLGGLETPAAGTGHYYLVRGSNVCATGGYGLDSEGTPRVTTACP